jgi:hypothetical protein
MALVVVIAMGLIAAALALFAAAGSRSTTSYKIERTRRYAADAALQVGIQRLRLDPLLAVTSTDSKCAEYRLREDASAPWQVTVLWSSTARMDVYCKITPNANIPNFPLDGGQRIRDITLTVKCPYTTTVVAKDSQDRPKLQCGNGSAKEQVVATARVRFEIDNSKPIDKRAVIPKVLSWSIRPA